MVFHTTGRQKYSIINAMFAMLTEVLKKQAGEERPSLAKGKNSCVSHSLLYVSISLVLHVSHQYSSCLEASTGFVAMELAAPAKFIALAEDNG